MKIRFADNLSGVSTVSSDSQPYSGRAVLSLVDQSVQPASVAETKAAATHVRGDVLSSATVVQHKKRWLSPGLPFVRGGGRWAEGVPLLFRSLGRDFMPVVTPAPDLPTFAEDIHTTLSCVLARCMRVPPRLVAAAASGLSPRLPEAGVQLI